MEKTNRNNITPIFVLGAARNGTTQLGNFLGSFESITSVEHFLHYGAVENQIYHLNKYWGSLNDTDRYIDFIYDFSKSDFFQLAKGNLEFHFSNKKNTVYDVFFELMDRFAQIEGNNYWVTKLDPQFGTDKIELDIFLQKLRKRYLNIKFISIQRDLYESCLSYSKMEGKYYRLRQYGIFKLPMVLLYNSRYYNTYYTLKPAIEKSGQILILNFTSIKHDKAVLINQIRKFIPIPTENIKQKDYQVNTSFVRNKKKEDFLIKAIATISINIFKIFPFLPRMIVNVYSIRKFKHKPQKYMRLLKYKYFEKSLKDDLKKTNALGLLNSIS